MRRLAHIGWLAFAVTVAVGCGSADAPEGNTLQNVTAIATAGKSTSASNKLWGCLTWEPAGKTTSRTYKATVGCGVILPGVTATTAK